ncbi:hypothetical protein ACVGXN_05560, partial [Enterobacter hormaechei]
MAILDPEGLGESPRFPALIMTAVWLIFGVVRIMLGTGGVPNSRQISATTVFSGMLVATVVGIVFIP